MAKSKSKKARRTAKAARGRKARQTTRRAADNRGTKQAQLIAMLQRPEGATLAQLMETLAWQPHSVRGALATIKKKGTAVTSEKPADGARVYRAP
jgi:hypothetical protein